MEVPVNCLINSIYNYQGASISGINIPFNPSSWNNYYPYVHLLGTTNQFSSEDKVYICTSEETEISLINSCDNYRYKSPSLLLLIRDGVFGKYYSELTEGR